MLTARGRCVLGLGLGVYLAAWAFGSKPLYPVALGLLAAVLLARIWTRVARRPIQLALGQGVGALVLDRVLGGDDHERSVEPVGRGVDRHLALLHGLEQGGLRLR